MGNFIGFVADILSLLDFLDFDKVTEIKNTTELLLILVILASWNSHRRKNKEIRAMQTEIDKMASANRILREDLLSQKGLTRKEISRLFPPDDKKRRR